MTCNPNPKPLSLTEEMMKSSPYKKFSGRLEKRRICCISLYAIYVFGFFFLFLRSSEHCWIYCIYLIISAFAPSHPYPHPYPHHTHTENKSMEWAVFYFLVCFNSFPEEDGGWIPPFCTFVTFVHGNHIGAF